ncbi:hypothetical protein PSP6_60087 [Paraburkholderia tropica]|nr:hypothetical protein PSP6_60087 [Paraburkholderia tropica]
MARGNPKQQSQRQAQTGNPNSACHAVLSVVDDLRWTDEPEAAPGIPTGRAAPP